MRHDRLAAAVLAVIGGLGLTRAASAATWDGGSGTWSTSDGMWDGGNNWVQNDPAVFSGTAGTVSLGENISAASITLSTANYVIDLSGFDLAVAGNVQGLGTHTITNTAGGAAKTLTIGNIVNNSGPNLSGNMNVIVNNYMAGGQWLPTSTLNFTGTLELLATAGSVRSDHNGQGLGSDAGLVRIGGGTTLILNTSSGQFRTFTRDVEMVTNTSAGIQVSGLKAATLTGNLSGSANFRLSGSQGMLVLAGDNTAYTGQFNGSAAGFFLVAQSDTAFGATSNNISLTGASGIGFMGDADGSVNVGAKNLSISGSAHGDGIGNVHNFSGTNSYAGNVTMSNIITMGAELNSELLMKGIISGTRPLNKVGGGTLVLGNANTYGNTTAGATDIRNGTLRLDFSQATAPLVDIINNGNASNSTASQLVLSGGTLEVKGKSGATNSQRFKNSATTGFTINSGAAAVRADQNGATSLSVDFGQLQTRNIGGTVDFTLPTAGTFSTPTGTANTILTRDSAAFATVGGVDWAAKNAANTSIVAGSSVTGFYTPNTATTLSGNADMSADGTTTLGSSPTISSLRFNNAGAKTVDATGQILTIGGILVTSNVGNNVSTITGGTLRGAVDRDLVIFQNNTANKLEIGSTLDNSGTSSGLTKTGAGTLELTGANTYLGPTTVTGGVLKLNNATALPGGNATLGGTSSLILKGGVIGLTAASGGFTRELGTGANQVQFTGSGGFAAYGGDRTVNINGGTASSTWNSTSSTRNSAFLRTGFNFILGADDADGMIDYQNGISMGGTSVPLQRIIEVRNGSAPIDAKLSGVLSGEAGFTKIGAGTLELSNANALIGRVMVDAGTLKLTGTLVGGGGTSRPPLIVNGGTFLVAGAGRVFGTTTVNSGGTVGGSSTPSPAATSYATITVNSGGTLAPGASIGSLTSGDVVFGNGSLFNVEINTAALTSDLLAITGNLSLSGNPLLSLTDLGGNISLPEDTTFTLATYSGTWNNGIFSGLPDDGEFTFGANTYVIDYNAVVGGGSGLTITTVAPIPEPATLGLLALGGLAALRRQRRH